MKERVGELCVSRRKSVGRCAGCAYVDKGKRTTCFIPVGSNRTEIKAAIHYVVAGRGGSQRKLFGCLGIQT